MAGRGLQLPTPALFLTVLAAAVTALPVVSLAAPDPFAACLSRLREQAPAKGVPVATFDAATKGLAMDQTVLDAAEKQPEFALPIWDYLAPLVDDERIADGKAMLRQWSQALSAAEARIGVDRYTLVAVWGVESDFGRAMGKRPLVTSLATLSCFGRRQAYFSSEFFLTLKIINRGDMRADQLTGSWAGAFGQTQFMPSNYWHEAVDLDGDGKIDLVGSVPDAVGSAANELKSAGWNPGLVWGYEVRLPAKFDMSLVGRKKKRPYAEWVQLGLKRPNGQALPEAGTAGLIAPAGASGPAFLVTRNFDALYSYNAAESYALAIAHLSDRLRGGGAFLTAWPTKDRGLTRAERRELQLILAKRGYDVGEPDGAIGPKTRQAVADVETREGLQPTGRAGGVVLDLLRKAH